MKAKILELKAFLFTSFWFLPILIIFAWWVLSFLTVYLDSSSGLWINIPYLSFLEWSVDSYRQILSTISSSMISLAGLVFSITLVALTLASGQFGSRILKNFMSNRLNQIVLGSYLATFTYCLLTLRIIRSENYIDFFPDISIFVALISALANIILLIFYIHHVALSIQADTLLKEIYEELSLNLKKLENKKDSKEASMDENIELGRFEISLTKYKHISEIVAITWGYITHIDREKLMSIASDEDILLRVLKISGDFSILWSSLIQISAKKMLDPDILQALTNCISISKTRSPLWDIKFSLQQLVEIAVRALSPGINDPFTALSSLSRIFSFLWELSTYKMPNIVHWDDKKNPRIIFQELTYWELIELSLTQIRHYAKESPFVLKEMSENLEQLSKLDIIDDFDSEIKAHLRATKKVLSKFSNEFLYYDVWAKT